MSKKILKTKVCIAEYCTNKSDSTDKIFISVPGIAEKKRRNAWLRACGFGQNDLSPKSHVYVCEDHFNMGTDCLNLADYKSGRRKKIVMDKNVIPHRFLRQDFSHLTGDVVTDAMSVSIQTCDIFSQAVNGVEPKFPNQLSFLLKLKPIASKSKQIDGIYSQATCDVDRSCVKEFALTEAFSWPTVDTVCKADKAAGTAPICFKNVGVNTDKCLKFADTVRSRAVQTNTKDFAKHGLLSNVSCSPFGSPWKVSNIEPKGSPVKLGNSKRKLNIPSEEDSSSSTESSDDDESHSSVTSESDYSDIIEEQNQEMLSFRQSSLFRTRKLLNWEPRTYLGILPERISFLTLLANKLSCNQDMFITAHDAVCLIFRKIRLNESFTILGYEFGISSREASRIFIKYVAFIADHIQEIIFWPKPDSLKRALPISFRKNYSKIQSIIDCFEIEIQKPSDPVNQALTWSEYKGCNTLKYMVYAGRAN
ncbi:hypothetical protein DAPPUDRAFT_329663 [Daphnia pulex]|uniref:THAP-type domain-containing protein n=1 Tax=Daphnia pulex TaxID=6669 RepID=E9HHA2_DAPPU|nr:hypothetical protein DAPPUDRAFT_329663 [Daphnia pulex]|eukprot:EFX68828.1 hypothetical protein DAPPUDRAFT_329663 [Daphnia pulex]